MLVQQGGLSWAPLACKSGPVPSQSQSRIGKRRLASTPGACAIGDQPLFPTLPFSLNGSSSLVCFSFLLERLALGPSSSRHEGLQEPAGLKEQYSYIKGNE